MRTTNRSALFAGTAALFVTVLFAYQNCSPGFLANDASSGGASLSSRLHAAVSTEQPRLHRDRDYQFNTTGVLFTAEYPSCPRLPVKADLYIQKNGTMEFQNRCYSVPSGGAEGEPASLGWCFFKDSLPAGTNGSDVMLRLWKSTNDCAAYADEVAFVTTDSYLDTFLTGWTSELSLHYQAVERLVTVDKPNYTVKLDRNGGAVYELYNKRAKQNNVTYRMNAIHAHMGAAVQIAVHQHQGPANERFLTGHAPVNGRMEESCDPNQGYWNPTQAGSYCVYDAAANVKSLVPQAPSPENSGMTIKCDGAVNNACSSANRSVEHTTFRMFNWDYGVGFAGPYAVTDTAYFAQTVTANDTFLQFDVSMQNRGINRVVAIEMPTVYFNNNFQRFYHRDHGTGAVIQRDFNRYNGSLDQEVRPNSPNEDDRWVSFENTENNVENDVYTIGWVFYPEVVADLAIPGHGNNISETTPYHAIKLTNQPTITMRANQTYRVRYFIFPYRYDEIIETSYGRMTVQQVIERMQAEANPGYYGASQSAPPSANPTATPTPPPQVAELPRFNEVESNDVLNGWPAINAIDLSPTSSYSSQGFLSQTNDRGAYLRASWREGAKTVRHIVLQGRKCGTKFCGFPIRYRVKIATPTGWVQVAENGWQPDATSGRVVIPLASPTNTNAVVVEPITLGADTYGNFYFQLVDLYAL